MNQRGMKLKSHYKKKVRKIVIAVKLHYEVKLNLSNEKNVFV